MRIEIASNSKFCAFPAIPERKVKFEKIALNGSIATASRQYIRPRSFVDNSRNEIKKISAEMKMIDFGGRITIPTNVRIKIGISLKKKLVFTIGEENFILSLSP